MMGIFTKKAEKTKTPKEAKSKIKISKSEFTRQTSERNLADFKKSGVARYVIRTCGDGRVCAACQKQNGKKYNTADAVIGKNAPPFCEECRCVMLPLYKEIKMPWG